MPQGRMRDPPASGGQESYRHGSRRVSQLKSISCANISASMAFEQNRFYQPPHSVNQVSAKIISSANSLETRSHQTESSANESLRTALDYCELALPEFLDGLRLAINVDLADQSPMRVFLDE